MTRPLRTSIAMCIAIAATVMIVAMPAAAAPGNAGAAFPTEFALPNGFLPEGIAIGSAPYAFFGSRADGDIFRVNLVTGEGTVISQGHLINMAWAAGTKPK